VEHTGQPFSWPTLPDLKQLAIIRPLPNSFAWSNGKGRSMEFDDWSRLRSEIKAEIEHDGIGVKPRRANV
jgi:hypothetical protein